MGGHLQGKLGTPHAAGFTEGPDDNTESHRSEHEDVYVGDGVGSANTEGPKKESLPQPLEIDIEQATRLLCDEASPTHSPLKHNITIHYACGKPRVFPALCWLNCGDGVGWGLQCVWQGRARWVPCERE